jgi:hypothetical protein
MFLVREVIIPGKEGVFHEKPGFFPPETMRSHVAIFQQGNNRPDGFQEVSRAGDEGMITSPVPDSRTTQQHQGYSR